MATPYLYYDDLITTSNKGGYVEKPKLSQLSSVFLLSVCYVARMRWLWQNPINPINDDEYDNILELITQAENELMISFGIGTIITSVVNLDSENTLLRMDGQTIAQADYPELTNIAPTSWLSGSDIILPDMDETSIHGGYASVGDEVGENDITLNISEIPSHNHTQNPHSHSYTQSIGTPTGAGPVVAAASIVVPTPLFTGLATAINNATGGDGSHNNIPLSMQVIYYLVAR